MSALDTKTQKLPKITLSTTRSERVQNEALGDLFAIVTAMEHLEKAYITDAITEKAYQKQCKKLIAQYKTLYNAVSDDVESLETFMRDYRMDCRAASIRFTIGVPATMVHGSSSSDGQDAKAKQLLVFQTVQHFITCKNCLELDVRAIDQLQPYTSDLMDSLNKVQSLPNDHKVKELVRGWLLKLSEKKAHDRLSDEEARQMNFDFEKAYSAFHNFVAEGK
jgi:chaperonin cofactor prefoldin